MRHAGMLSSMRMNGTRVIALAARPSLLGALLVLGGCAATASPPEPNDNGEAKAGTQPEAVTLEDFTEGRWSLRVNRSLDTASTQVTNPSNMLPEDDYKAVPPSEETVLVSSGGSTIAVGSTPVTGSRARTSTPTRLVFELSQGTFAGGRFVVWQGEKSLEAELTIFGSGRPIVESRRGDLVPAQ